MSEAAGALVHAFFAYAGGTCLTAGALPANRASQRVIEKTGFRWTDRRSTPSPARGCARDLDWFALDGTEWAARRRVTEPDAIDAS